MIRSKPDFLGLESTVVEQQEEDAEQCVPAGAEVWTWGSHGRPWEESSSTICWNLLK